MIDFSILERQAKDQSNWVGLGVGAGVGFLAYTRDQSIPTSLLFGVVGGAAGKFGYKMFTDD